MSQEKTYIIIQPACGSAWRASFLIQEVYKSF